MLSAFLWQGVELKSSGAKVAWASVFVPKKEGGLGFKRMKEWNRASMLRHMWALCKKEDSLGKVDSFLCDERSLHLLHS